MTAVIAEVDAHEGPVYVADEDALYFTSLRGPGGRDVAIQSRCRCARASASTSLRADANGANGMTLRPRRPAGRLRAGHAATRPARIAPRRPRAPARRETRRRRRGDGLPLNSPNDVVVDARRRDLVHRPELRPPPGLPAAAARSATSSTATTRRPASTTVVADTFDKPNGLAFSPDERVLYVTDSAPTRSRHLTRRPHRPSTSSAAAAWPTAGCSPSSTPASPTASRSTPTAASTSSCPSGVQVFDPDGEPARRDRLPGAVNFAFGGAERNVLFITTDTAVWAAALDPKGALNLMTLVRTRRIIDDAGADAVIAAAERRGREHGAPRRDRASSTRPASSSRCAARGRAGRQLARRRRQGAHRGDLRPPEPRDRAAGHERPPRRARAARRRRR